MPLVFTPYILSCDEMFIVDATNEAGDTESRDADYDQIEVVVIEVVGAAAAHGFRYGRDHPNLFV